MKQAIFAVATEYFSQPQSNTQQGVHTDLLTAQERELLGSAVL